MGDCHPILGRGTSLFPTIVQHENRWLSPFFWLILLSLTPPLRSGLCKSSAGALF